MKVADIKTELQKLGYSLTGDETPLQLSALLKKAKKGNTNGSSKDEKHKGKVLVWLKGRAYVSDTKRLDAGVYQMNEVPDRLAEQPSSVVVVFANGVPARDLYAIARWAGIAHPEEKTDEEILNIVIKEAKPF